MPSDYIPPETFEDLLFHMTPENALALRISLETGLRIGDVLKARWRDLDGNRLHFRASKTGKKSVVELSPETVGKILTLSPVGGFLFPGRKPGKHRTRQAVYMNIRKAAKELLLPEHATPHSARKTFAVQLRKGGAAERDIQAALQHSDRSTTRIYSRSDKLDLTPERLDELIDVIVEKVWQRVLKRLNKSEHF